MRLYDLAVEYRNLSDKLAASDDGELSSEDIAAISAIEQPMEAKIGNVVAMYREFEAEAEGIKSEADRLAKIARSRSNSATRLKLYVKDCLEMAGIKSVQTFVGRVQIQKNSKPSIAWNGLIDDIPEYLKRVTVELDGVNAYAAWKADALPEGFNVTIGSHVRVY